MPAPAAALAQYRRQQAITARTVAGALALWARMDPDALAETWALIASPLWRLMAGAQVASASAAAAYVPAVLEEQGIDPGAVATARPRSLAGVASDGRELEPLLYSAVALAREGRFGLGLSGADALARGRDRLASIVATQAADAGRVATSVAAFTRPAANAYVRALNLPSCSRCVVLAGRVYKSSQAFDRHPRCDCVHVPSAESIAGDATTSPRAAFDSLTEAEQNRIFTNDGARAIRDGADLGQVVNARRGMRPASVYGRDVLVTSEGTTVRGVAGRALGDAARARGQRYRSSRTPRLMPESIYGLAGDDRGEALRLLRRFGYIT